MTTISFGLLKQNNENNVNNTMTENGVFWAFNQEQFEEGKLKNPLEEGEKYISIGMGGYMPKRNNEKLKETLDTLRVEFRKAVIENNLQEDEILYHLCNHECFYSGDIEDAMQNLISVYTHNEVLKVFYDNINNY